MTSPGSEERELDSNDEVKPVVPLPRTGLSSMAIVLLCGALAIGLFVFLNNARRAREAAKQRPVESERMIASPAPLQLPVEPAVPRAAEVIQPAILRPLETPRPIFSQQPTPLANIPTGSPVFAPPSQNAYTPPTSPPATVSSAAKADPVLILDTGSGPSIAATTGKGSDAAEELATDEGAIRATIIRNRTNLVPQGTIIYAILETPIDSTRPGLVRAVIARDARGFDGSRVLIPRGSRLIGQASGDVRPGQNRVLVDWSRLIRPDGIAIKIGSPASDNLGGTGVRGSVNSHFLERFANAVLQTTLTAGVIVATRSANNPYIYALPGQVGSASQSFFPNVAPIATVKVPAGKEIAVFVAHDLDFGGTVNDR